MKVSITLNEASQAVVNAAIKDNPSLTAESFLDKLVEKVLEQRKVQFARSRLNAGKEFIVNNIRRNAKGFESLEQAYMNAGLSEDVHTFGGIRKVYEEIYDKAGEKFRIEKSKIRMAIAVINPTDAKQA